MPDHDLGARVDAVFAELGYSADDLGDDTDTNHHSAIIAVVVFAEAARLDVNGDEDAAERYFDDHFEAADTGADAVDLCLDLCTAGAMMVARMLQKVAEAHDARTDGIDSYMAVFDVDASNSELINTAMRAANFVARDKPYQLAHLMTDSVTEHGPEWMRHLLSMLLDLYGVVRREYREVSRDR